jgi:HrpA-like RNA helicase
VTRRAILSTNVAESSLTIPDCEVVVDFCLTKTMHYHPHSLSEELIVGWASKASLKQRAGRTGRTRDGTCYRLITREFYMNLPEYEVPEITRCPIEKTILRIAQIHSQDKNELFSRPSAVLLNLLDPPDIHSIHKAASRFVQIDALEEKD